MTINGIYGIMIDNLTLDKVINSLWHFHNSCGCQPCRGGDILLATSIALCQNESVVACS